MSNILITGACGQLGSELTAALREKWGSETVLATDVSEPNPIMGTGPFERLDVLDKGELERVISEHKIEVIYHLAALLSARAEQNIGLAWSLNMDGLLNVLNSARQSSVKKVFWPSSIAVFGPDAKTEKTPQESACNPTTVYGISKLAGEQWCAYYHRKFGVDVRSLRYPGLIGYKTMPGGGTTDYAVDIYHKAVRGETFNCFLKPESKLPMMYMEDAVKATIDLMDAPADALTIRTSYNVSAMSFSPEEIAASIRKMIHSFEIEYKPDYRQSIAESWPDSIDDSAARRDWNWRPSYNLDSMSKDVIENLPQFWDLELPDTVK